ncbi:MAG: methyltransferase [Oscillochloridaceae bacterium umkhey_bin13]
MSYAYDQLIHFEATLAGTPVQVVSKPGLADAEQVSDLALLAADLIRLAPTERVALLGCGHGALGVALARQLPHGTLLLHDPNQLAVQMARLTLEANGIANATVSPALSQLPEAAASFDRVVILAPQARDLARRWLVEALALLRPDGLINLAGAKRGGIEPLIRDLAALCGNATTLGYGRGCRVAQARRGETLPDPPAWATLPGIAPGSWLSVETWLPGGPPVTLASLPGVFSAEQLDAGTALLLAQLGPLPGQRVLDIGCGYGPIGLAAARLGAAQVDLLDVSLLAVAATRQNITRLGLEPIATVAASDALAAVRGRCYDLILSNPPFHAGRSIDTRMANAFISQAHAVLAPGGRLQLVANRFLTYERALTPWFAQVREVAATASYRVLEGVRG